MPSNSLDYSITSTVNLIGCTDTVAWYQMRLYQSGNTTAIYISSAFQNQCRTDSLPFSNFVTGSNYTLCLVYNGTTTAAIPCINFTFTTTHNECDSGGICRQVNGAGTDQCSVVDQPCPRYNKCNDSGWCQSILGTGTSECTTPGQACSWYSECDSNNICQLIVGKGTNKCPTPGQPCSGGSIQNYQCNTSTKACSQSSCTPNNTTCFSDPNACNTACSATDGIPPPPPSQSCSSSNCSGMCLSGNCIDKTMLIVGGLIVFMMMMKR